MEYLYSQGNWVESQSKKTFAVINPATKKNITEVSLADGTDTNIAIDDAHNSFQEWKKTTPYYRSSILKTAADIIRKNVAEYSKTIVEESGKPFVEAKGEFHVCANLFEWYAEECKRANGKIVASPSADRRNSIIFQPIGVVGIITAWNFPAYNPARAWAAALGAGCTIVAKPSEDTPLTAIHIAKALIEAGLPKGVLQLIYGNAPAIGEAMLAHPLLRKISFTGSTRVGKILMDGASKTNTKLSLELGGNAPVIIMDDCDIEQTAKGAVIGKFRNNGQVCVSPQRFYIHESIYESLTKRILHYASKIKIGFGYEENVTIGPLINEQQYKTYHQFVETIKKEGWTIHRPVSIPEHCKDGYFVEPLVVTNVKHTSVFSCKEIFGPILPLIPFSSKEEVLEWANDTEYGLSAYIFTSNINTMYQLSEGIEAGLIGVNAWTAHGTELPFTGWKQSGIGSESGQEGLYEYLERKVISIAGI